MHFYIIEVNKQHAGIRSILDVVSCSVQNATKHYTTGTKLHHINSSMQSGSKLVCHRVQAGMYIFFKYINCKVV